jgi:threonine dehydratase
VAKHERPDIRVIGVEPSGADDAQRSFRTGTLVPMLDPHTIADGLRTSLGPLTLREITEHVDDIVTVSDAAIVDAMREIWEVLKLVVEPSAAVPYAAIREGAFDATRQRVGVVLTGGNLDLDRLPWQ